MFRPDIADTANPQPSIFTAPVQDQQDLKA
jgi:hypothetical protein